MIYTNALDVYDRFFMFWGGGVEVQMVCPWRHVFFRYFVYITMEFESGGGGCAGFTFIGGRFVCFVDPMFLLSKRGVEVRLCGGL